MAHADSDDSNRGGSQPTEDAVANNTSEGEEEEEFFDARLTPEEEGELVEQSNAQKLSANNLFASSAFSDAVSVYDRAISLLPSYLDYQIAVLRSNIAACHLKLQDWNAAVESATGSLECLDRSEDDNPSQSPNQDKRSGQRQSSDVVVELTDDDIDDEHVLEQLAAYDKRKDDIKRLRSKSLLRRARARMQLGGWAQLEGAQEDYKALLSLDYLSTSEQKAVRQELQELPTKLNAAKEKEMGDVMGKLKDLGNGVLRPFGLSTDNFQFIKDEKTGGYSMSYQN